MARKTALTYLGRLVVIVFIGLTLNSSAVAAEYKVLHKFQSPLRDGIWPQARLIFDNAGNLYGTTKDGGIFNGSCGGTFCGTVFKLTLNPDGSWTETLLYSFLGGTDGAWPEAELVFDTEGNLYGTTVAGGDSGGQHNCWDGLGCGTVFKLTPNKDGSWTESVIYRFEAGADGAVPEAGLTFDASGNLYGTAPGGDLGGVVFKLAPNPDGSWTQSALWTFTDADGKYPYAGLSIDSAGNLYGATWGGGAYGYGTVFKLTPKPDGGWTESVLHSFRGSDGIGPHCDLIFDTAGNLYGTTFFGGAYGRGTVFKLASNPDGSWTMNKLHTFNGEDGGYPNAGLISDAAGNLYGTTEFGGAYDSGTIFKLTPKPNENWKLTKLHAFKNHHPVAGLVLDASGSLYGTAPGGGKGYGVVFQIKP